MTKDFKLQTQVINDEQGNKKTDPESIAEVWRRYCSNLFKDDTGGAYDLPDAFELEPDILRSEVESAIKKLRNRKSPGSDGITAETIKAMGEIGIDIFWVLCNKIWREGKWPSEWCESIFVPIYKKGSPVECTNYRTVALIPHASKILLHIIHKRLEHYLLPEMAEEQCGFIPGKGTREQILNVRQLIEKAREFNVTAFLLFVDFEKAFDSVKWHYLWEFLHSFGVPDHLISLMKKLYDDNSATVRVNQTTSARFRTQAGTRQGCILSPALFNAYTEFVMRKVLENWEGGVSVGGKKFNNLRYADDTTIIAGNAEDLEDIMERLERICLEYGLRINKAKTKVMIIDRPTGNQPQRRRIAGYEVVDSFTYLGSLITNTGGSSEEIRRRITMARSATSKLTKIWKDRSISNATKLRLAKALIFPIATYAAETWTMKKADRKRIESFEMWVYRRILRVSWTEHRTNQSVLDELRVKERLLPSINKAFLTFFGHVARRNGSNEQLMVEGKVEGRRSRGRSPSRWVDQLKPLLGVSLPQAVHMAEDRVAWREQARRATS